MEPQTNSELTQKKQLDIDAKKSSLKGVGGFVETLLRRFRIIFHLSAMLMLYAVGSVCIAIAAIPSIYLFMFILHSTAGWPTFFHYFALSFAGAFGYFLFGICLLFALPALNALLPMKLKPWRGIYFSLQSIPWYIHNALTYMARYSFLNFATPSPLNLMFYRLMGMKIGRGTMINTTNISDPCMVELGKKVTVGGSATIICHYAAGGFLVLAPVKIGDGATVGMKSTIMGDVEIGAHSKILAHAVVMPKTRIPDGEIWGGVPAEFIRKVRTK